MVAAPRPHQTASAAGACYPREVSYSLLVGAILLAELASLVLMVSYAGWLMTLGLLAGAFVLGMLLLSGRGGATVRSVILALRGGRSPGAALIDSALMAFAGILLITPGFASDVIAIALLLPPVRAGARNRLQAAVRARIARVRGGATQPLRDDEIEVIDASATEVPAERAPRGSTLPS